MDLFNLVGFECGFIPVEILPVPGEISLSSDGKLCLCSKGSG